MLVQAADAGIERLTAADPATLAVIDLACFQIQASLAAHGAMLVVQQAIQLHIEIVSDDSALTVIEAAQAQACVTFGGKQAGLVE